MIYSPETQGQAVPVAVVHLGLGTQKLLLAGLVGQHPADLVAVLLGLQQGDQVDARPHLLSCQFAGEGR